MRKICQILEKSRFNQVWDDLEAGIGISMQNNAQNMGSNHDFDDFHFFLNFFLTVQPLNLTHLSAGLTRAPGSSNPGCLLFIASVTWNPGVL